MATKTTISPAKLNQMLRNLQNDAYSLRELMDSPGWESKNTQQKIQFQMRELSNQVEILDLNFPNLKLIPEGATSIANYSDVQALIENLGRHLDSTAVNPESLKNFVEVYKNDKTKEEQLKDTSLTLKDILKNSRLEADKLAKLNQELNRLEALDKQIAEYKSAIIELSQNNLIDYARGDTAQIRQALKSSDSNIKKSIERIVDYSFTQAAARGSDNVPEETAYLITKNVSNLPEIKLVGDDQIDLQKRIQRDIEKITLSHKNALEAITSTQTNETFTNPLHEQVKAVLYGRDHDSDPALYKLLENQLANEGVTNPVEIIQEIQSQVFSNIATNPKNFNPHHSSGILISNFHLNEIKPETKVLLTYALELESKFLQSHSTFQAWREQVKFDGFSNYQFEHYVASKNTSVIDFRSLILELPQENYLSPSVSPSVSLSFQRLITFFSTPTLTTTPGNFYSQTPPPSKPLFSFPPFFAGVIPYNIPGTNPQIPLIYPPGLPEGSSIGAYQNLENSLGSTPSLGNLASGLLQNGAKKVLPKLISGFAGNAAKVVLGKYALIAAGIAAAILLVFIVVIYPLNVSLQNPIGTSGGGADSDLISNPYIGVTKTGTPDKLDKPTGNITYNYTIVPKQGTLTNVKITSDNILIFSTNGSRNLTLTTPTPPTNIDSTWNSDPYTFNLDSSMNDSILTNTITVSATAPDGSIQSVQASFSVIIGNPPTGCYVFNNGSAGGVTTVSWDNYPGQKTMEMGAISTILARLGQNYVCGGPINLYLASSGVDVDYGGWYLDSGKIALDFKFSSLGTPGNALYTLAHETGHELTYRQAGVFAAFTQSGLVSWSGTCVGNIYPFPSYINKEEDCYNENFAEGIACHVSPSTANCQKNFNSNWQSFFNQHFP